MPGLRRYHFRMTWEKRRKILEEHHPAIWSRVAPLCERAASVIPPAADAPYQESPLLITGRPPDQHSERFCFVFGVGTGENLRQLYLERRRRLVHLVILEPSVPSLAVMLRHSDCYPLLTDGRIRWLCGDLDQALHDELLERFTTLGIFGAQMLFHRPTMERYTAAWNRAFETTRRIASASWENRRVCNQSGVELQLNLIHNIPWLISGMNPQYFENRYTGATAVAIGAGPSLDRNIAALRQAPPSVLLIAADTALRSLRREGVEPHFILTCDPTPINRRHFEGIHDLGRSVLAFMPEAYRGVLAQYARHNRMLSLRDRESKLLERLGDHLAPPIAFQRGSNAGYLAFSLARWLGCRSIILAGMDLSVPRQGRSHASDSVNASDIVFSDDGTTMRLSGIVESTPSPVVEVPGYWGGSVPTFPHFAQVLWKIEEDIERDGLEVIDATEGGALKRGAIQTSLSQAIRLRPEKSDHWRDLESLPWLIPAKWSPGLITCITGLYQELRNSKRTLSAAQASIQQWSQSRKNAPDGEAVTTEAERFFERWRSMLASEPLDSTLDVALAQLRFNADRMETAASGNSPLEANPIGEQLIDEMKCLDRLIDTVDNEWRALLSRFNPA